MPNYDKLLQALNMALGTAQQLGDTQNANELREIIADVTATAEESAALQERSCKVAMDEEALKKKREVLEKEKEEFEKERSTLKSETERTERAMGLAEVMERRREVAQAAVEFLESAMIVMGTGVEGLERCARIAHTHEWRSLKSKVSVEIEDLRKELPLQRKLLQEHLEDFRKELPLLRKLLQEHLELLKEAIGPELAASEIVREEWGKMEARLDEKFEASHSWSEQSIERIERLEEELRDAWRKKGPMGS